MSDPAADPVATFRLEAAELLVQLEETLLDLEGRPQDMDLVNKAFRALHTIKGSGAMFGFDAVAAFTHHLETAFDQVRSHRQPVTGDLVNQALASLDHIRQLIDAPEQADPATGEALLAALRSIMGEAGSGTAAPRAAAAPPAEPSPATWRIRYRPARDSLGFGSNPLLLIRELRELGTCTVVGLTEAIPPLEELDPCGCYMAWDLVLTTSRPRPVIEEVFLFVAEDIVIEAVEPPPAAAQRLGEILIARGDTSPEAVSAVVEAQEAERPRLGDLLVDKGVVTPEKVVSALAEQQHIREHERPAAAGGEAAQTVRVQADRLDSLMDKVGELVIAQARLRQSAQLIGDATLHSITEEIERLAADLRDTTMGIRMLPIGTLFGRFRRLIHDLSRDLKKQVRLATEGEETELDKTVIEALNDPLVHLIRNAVDHGIAGPEERQRQGKPAQGVVRLSAVHSGAHVLVTVADDGQGLDHAAIRAKAEERGLLAPGAELGEHELFSLIFRPGFSTAKTVSNVSGRGVGMDVVKQAVDALHGSIEVHSAPGEGTAITLKLPLTLAIIDGLLVRVAGSHYVIPLAVTEECVELSEQQDHDSLARNFLNIRDEVVPFIRLRELFNSAGQPAPYQKAVIVGQGERRVGLVVDQVVGQYQTVIKSLSKLLDDVEGFSGATILGDGSVALILDIPHLLHFAQAREATLRLS